ncbi:E3 ubiquitin-protein ligase UBR2-like [Branchiostoma lanceolatum]|uniref:E3 ubiquitin-protein ligase UBR2-like n=1 Tax=Branchiostoma lanceolatum TaxID=7740 RepID=UPI003453ABF8
MAAKIAGNLEGGNVSIIVQQLQGAYERGQLKNALYQYWAQQVPKIFFTSAEVAISTQRTHDAVQAEEKLSRDVLFEPLEWFLCGGNPAAVFQQLQSLNNPPQLCGKVFKVGEPTYSCRDCCADPTCVFCIECFNKSTHKTHRYRMSTSGGGGYCDCGDVEAWKQDPWCDIHKQGLGQQSQNPIEKLPKDVAARAWEVLKIALQYAVDILLWEQMDGLPQDLEPSVQQNTYVTMLFNDEIHTYEQVINALTRAISCQQKEAVEFATVVDREGRSSVRYGNRKSCDQARSIIQRSTSLRSKPLKVEVMHTSVCAHQAFAQKVLNWLGQVVNHSDGLRHILCTTALQQPPTGDLCVVERLMLADTALWKIARVQCHQIMMGSLLMDQESKKQFSVLYTRNYPQVQMDFMADDHDHGVSIISLSVQIFTVPTLARYLIMEHDLLAIVIRTFLEQCASCRHGRYLLDREKLQKNFRRLQFPLLDLKYVLSMVPDQWNDQLKRKFMNGFKIMAELLTSMQGMDSVTRQVGQHIEMEPEWESAFNLQIKLAPAVAMMAGWCATDKMVLIDAFRIAVKALLEISQLDTVKKCKRRVCDQEAIVVDYTVSREPVSIHLPICRLLAGLYLQLGKYGLTFNSPELYGPLQPPIAMDLLEQPLKTLVMIAQVHAEMWKRNGYSLFHQVYYYHNVRCRSEMQDKDIIMLQVACAQMDPNQFLIALLNKFELMNWIEGDFDDFIRLFFYGRRRDVTEKGSSATDDLLRFTNSLVEEFLNFLIIIIGERYVPGIGQVSSEDMVKREVIHQLCISPMAHSDLSKALPENHKHETGMEAVIADVSTFKKPGVTGMGRYELKPEFYKDYNPFFYHYTRADQSKAKEAQLKRKKQEGESTACPPPEMPALSKEFSGLVNVLECDVFVHTIRTVFRRVNSSRSRSWTEAMVHRALHLVGMALNEEKRLYQTSPYIRFNFVKKATEGGSNSLYSALHDLLGKPRIQNHADLLTWAIDRFDEVKALKEQKQVMSDAQKAKKVSSKSKTDAERKKKAEAARKRREKILAQMSDMQKSFIRDNLELFEATGTELSSSPSMEVEGSPMVAPSQYPVAVGPDRSPATHVTLTTSTCILCQEDQEVSVGNKCVVLAAYVQRSTALSKSRGRVLEDPDKYDPLLVSPDLYHGVHTSTCGHVMHADCWQRFYEAIVAKEQRRALRFRHILSYEVDRGEFLCPLCETLSNTVIPILPPSTTIQPDSVSVDISLSFSDWLDGLKKTVEASQRAMMKEEEDKMESSDDLPVLSPCPLPSITKNMAEMAAQGFQQLFEYMTETGAQAPYSDSVKEMMKLFSRATYTNMLHDPPLPTKFGLGLDPNDDDDRVPITAWGTCAYTIRTLEWLLRDQGKPLFGSLSSRQADCITALVRVVTVSGSLSDPQTISKSALRLLSALLPQEPMKNVPCILDVDMFFTLVFLHVTFPSLYCDENTAAGGTIRGLALNDKHLLHLITATHLVQILLAANFSSADAPMDTEETAEGSAWVKLFMAVRKEAGLQTAVIPSGWQLQTYVRESVLPFLRCSALFFHCHTGVQSSAELQESGVSEFEPLCQYLALPPDLSSLLQQNSDVGNGYSVPHTIHSKWCQYPGIKESLASGPASLVKYPIAVNKLVPLPQDYSDVINKGSVFTCPRSDGDDSRAPTMCLVCGQMLCSQSYCCQTDLDGEPVGACTAHIYTCGAGVGIFLRVRECQILLLTGKTKGCFYPSPYLDDYGEHDQGLRRGNPLYLCQERYKKLQKLWLSHSIPEEVVHFMEANASFATIEWQHL